MNLDAEQISKKSSAVSFALMLSFGVFGAHRFYVGKWKSGLLYLLFGSIVPGARLINQIMLFAGDTSILKLIGYIYISFLLVCVAVLYDIYALYSESFTDKEGKVVLGGSRKDEIVGRTMQEVFNDKLTSSIIFLLFVLVIIIDILIL